MLLDDLLEHLDSFAALIRQNKTGRQFLSCIRVVRFQFENTQVKWDRFLQLLRCGVIVCYILEDRGVVCGVFGCSFENLIDLFQFVRFRLRLRLEKNGHIKLSQVHPEIGIVTANFCGALQSLERLFFLSCCNFDFDQTLVTVHVCRIQGDSAIGIIDRLIRFLQIPRIDKSELLIRLGIVRVCFDCVFQHVNRLWKIVLLYQQTGHAASELRLARIDVEHPAIRV